VQKCPEEVRKGDGAVEIKLYKEPELKNPVMLCGWPGIGNIGIIAIDNLKGALKAQEFGEIGPLDFFEPRKVVIEKGLLKDLEFPSSKFYFQRIKNQDVMFFIGEEQPSKGRMRYAEGQKAYQIANSVLDVAEKFGCRRVYTSGAAVTQIHHTVKPRVWAVPNKQSLIKEIKDYENTILMSEIDGRSSQGTITGLNGLLLGVAKKRNLEAICLMGEIPYYLQGAPWPYPKGSKSVLEVLAKILDIEIDVGQLDELTKTVEQNIEEFLESLYKAEAIPPQVRDEIEKLKYARPAEPGPITEEEQKKMMEHIDELFREGGSAR
jgi:proteasome assembly chaperone (PAC2) family protein